MTTAKRVITFGFLVIWVVSGGIFAAYFFWKQRTQEDYWGTDASGGLWLASSNHNIVKLEKMEVISGFAWAYGDDAGVLDLDLLVDPNTNTHQVIKFPRFVLKDKLFSVGEGASVAASLSNITSAEFIDLLSKPYSGVTFELRSNQLAASSYDYISKALVKPNLPK